VVELPDGALCIIATGPLTSNALMEKILAETGEDNLAFFDSIAPIIYKDSIDMDVAWFQSRYDKGDGKDYLNCPMTEQQYKDFIQGLLDADKTQFKEWEKDTPYFEACLPIEVMAERGAETLRFGPLKPVGLTNEHEPDIKPYAIVQLRQDNKLGTLYNMVGFQTKMTYGAQTELLRTIPALENAVFARLGGIHKNSFIQSPKLLDEQLRLKHKPNIRFAGQITGVEGYVESSAIGLLAGRFAAAQMQNSDFAVPPIDTALGALIHHIIGGHLVDNAKQSFQPMNINFGLLPPLEKVTGKKIYKKDRKMAYTQRAKLAMSEWLKAS